MVVPVTSFVSGSFLCQPNDESMVGCLETLSTTAPLSRSPSLASDAELSSACDSNCVTREQEELLEAMLPKQVMASNDGIDAAQLEPVTASKASSTGLRRIARSYDFREFGVLDGDLTVF